MCPTMSVYLRRAGTGVVCLPAAAENNSKYLVKYLSWFDEWNKSKHFDFSL